VSVGEENGISINSKEEIYFIFTVNKRRKNNNIFSYFFFFISYSSRGRRRHFVFKFGTVEMYHDRVFSLSLLYAHRREINAT
jgi:hypothetical protein